MCNIGHKIEIYKMSFLLETETFISLMTTD